jgi:hypothetical protein
LEENNTSIFRIEEKASEKPAGSKQSNRPLTFNGLQATVPHKTEVFVDCTETQNLALKESSVTKPQAKLQKLGQRYYSKSKAQSCKPTVANR